MSEGDQARWVAAEFLAVALVLIAGAGYRFLLSSAVPYDNTELAILARSNSGQHGIRMAFVMFNGFSLALFYLVARRSWGPVAALTAEFAIQTFPPFQHAAMRISWVPLVAALTMLGLTVWRFGHPPKRLPEGTRRPLLAVLAGLVIWGCVLWALLPGQLTARLDGADPAEIVDACGAGPIPVTELHQCGVPWPANRSLAQQELMLEQRVRARSIAQLAWDDPSLAAVDDHRVAVLDPKTAAWYAVEPGEDLDVVLRLLGQAPGSGNQSPAATPRSP